jgi:hypothetical protein
VCLRRILNYGVLGMNNSHLKLYSLFGSVKLVLLGVSASENDSDFQELVAPV